MPPQIKTTIQNISYETDVEKIKGALSGLHLIDKTVLSTLIGLNTRCTDKLLSKYGENYLRSDYTEAGLLSARIIPKLIKLEIIKKRNHGRFEII